MLARGCDVCNHEGMRNPRGCTKCPGPISRRSFLQVGSLAFGGFCMSDLFRMQSMAKAEQLAAAQGKSVIFVWLPGGPPHLDTFDMKPEAPSEYRGELRPIKTNVPGIEITELFPLHAKVADKFTIIRSISHEFADHGGGHKRVMTGRKPATPTGTINDAPCVQSIVAKSLEDLNVGVPNSIALDDGDVNGHALGSAYLGPACQPFMVGGDPSQPKWTVRNLELDPGMATRLDDRMKLLGGLDSLRREVDRTGVMDAMDGFSRRALELMTSPKARDAFDMTKEADATRDRYGRHTWGQRALLSRRLVEAGCSFVTVVMENPAPPGGLPENTTYNWDSHAVNCHIFTDLRMRAPYYDQAISALIEDLYRRGLDKKVMLVVTGEFGRTPRLEYQNGNGRPGRDHYPNAMSVVVAGGGMRTGQVVGSTDRYGTMPKDRPLTPNDLWATVYRHLGIDFDQTFPDHSGRPQLILPFGEPIREILPA
jgi:hypothetical protein